MDRRRLALLAVPLFTSCATARPPAPGQDPRHAYFQQERQEIDDSENRSVRQVLASGEHEIDSIAQSPGPSKNPGPSRNDPSQQVAGEQTARLDECRTSAAREKETLSERERKQYQDDAQKEGGRKSLMMILSTGPR